MKSCTKYDLHLDLEKFDQSQYFSFDKFIKLREKFTLGDVDWYEASINPITCDRCNWSVAVLWSKKVTGKISCWLLIACCCWDQVLNDLYILFILVHELIIQNDIVMMCHYKGSLREGMIWKRMHKQMYW